METLGSLTRQLRLRLDEMSARAWSDEALRRWVYEGACEVAKKTECLQTTTTIDVAGGDQEYDLPTDIVRVYRVEWIPDGDVRNVPLEYRDFNTADAVWWSNQSTASADPYMFTMWGFPPQLKLIVYPIPSGVGEFKVFYYKLPTSPFVNLDDPDNPVPEEDEAAQDAATIECPEGWHTAVLDYAEYLALRKDSDPRWQESKALFEEKISDLVLTSTRWTDQAGVVVGYGGSALPRWLWDENY